MNWDRIQEESIQYLQEYLRIKTVNPPGNEIEGALFFKRIFNQESVPCEIFEPFPGRGNLLATLKGDGTKKAILLLSHMDVVPVENTGWDFDPFGGIIKDGYLYGRGALDDKSMGIIEMMALLVLKRENVPLKRDILFLAAADEETGGRSGVEWAAGNLPVLQECEFALNEGGYIILDENGRPDRYEISSGQKLLFQLRMTARGTPGHASLPHSDNPNVKLVHALDSITQWKTPFNILPMVGEYFRRIAPKQPPDEIRFYEDIRNGLKDSSFAGRLTSDSVCNAMLRDTISLTILRGGSKVNVIPSESTATLDCRLIPGSSKEDFLKEIRKRAGDEMEIEVISESRSLPPSPWETDFVRAIERYAAQNDPGCLVVPYLLSGATDSRILREKGISCYDFCPFRITAKEHFRVHGSNERIAIENLKTGTRMLVEVLKELAA